MEILSPLNDCKICGFVSDNLTKHVHKIHALTTQEYKILHPGAKLVYISDARRETARLKTLKWFENADNKNRYKKCFRSIWQKQFWIDKGLSEEDAIAKVSSLQVRKFSEKTKELYSKQRTGSMNSMSLESIAIRNNCSIDEARCLVPASKRIKEKHPMYGKHHTPEAIAKICANTPTTFFNKSVGERELQGFVASLTDSSVNFNHGISRYNCDVVLNDLKIVIEYFGDYWHCNPKKYEQDFYNKRLHITALERWNKDKAKKEHIESLGFEYHVIWEYDWNNNKETIKENIKCLIQ